MGSGTDMDSGVGKCLKFLLIFFNLIIFALGMGLVIISIVFMNGYKEKVESVAKEQIFATTVYMILAGGVIVSIISFFGCCGAWKESKCMLVTYAGILLLILIIIGAGSFLYLTNKDAADVKIKDALMQSLNKTTDESKVGNETRNAWNDFQKQAECCGITGKDDWKKIGTKVVPPSCCPKQKCTASNYYDVGCYTLVKEGVKQLAMFGLVAFIVVLITIGMTIAVCFNIRSEGGYGQYA